MKKKITISILVFLVSQCSLFQTKTLPRIILGNYERFVEKSEYPEILKEFVTVKRSQFTYFNKANKVRISEVCFQNKFQSLAFFYKMMQTLQPQYWWLKLDKQKAKQRLENIMRPIAHRKIRFNYYNYKNLLVYVNKRIIHVNSVNPQTKKQWLKVLLAISPLIGEKIKKPVVLSLFFREQTRARLINYKTKNSKYPTFINPFYFFSPWVKTQLLNKSEFKSWRSLAKISQQYLGFRYFTNKKIAERALYRLSQKSNTMKRYLTTWFSPKHNKNYKVILSKPKSQQKSYFVLANNLIFALWGNFTEQDAMKTMLDILESWEF